MQGMHRKKGSKIAAYSFCLGRGETQKGKDAKNEKSGPVMGFVVVEQDNSSAKHERDLQGWG